MLIPVMVMLLALAPAPFSEAAQKELKKLQGKWKTVKSFANGNEQALATDAADLVTEIKGNKILMKDKELAVISALDPATDPKMLDFQALVLVGATVKGRVYEAIYKLDGDTLVIAFHTAEGQQRPEKLESPEGSGIVVGTLKRVND